MRLSNWRKLCVALLAACLSFFFSASNAETFKERSLGKDMKLLAKACMDYAATGSNGMANLDRHGYKFWDFKRGRFMQLTKSDLEDSAFNALPNGTYVGSNIYWQKKHNDECKVSFAFAYDGKSIALANATAEKFLQTVLAMGYKKQVAKTKAGKPYDVYVKGADQFSIIATMNTKPSQVRSSGVTLDIENKAK